MLPKVAHHSIFSSVIRGARLAHRSFEELASSLSRNSESKSLHAIPALPYSWPIFVVSLADASDRRDRISRALDARCLSFTFVDAVDGRRGLPTEYEAQVDREGTLRDFGRPLSDAEYACALSHLSVYRRIVESNLPGAIVLEDDAIITPLFEEFLLAKGYTFGDLIQLDHLHGDVWLGTHRHKVTPGLVLARAARNTSLNTGYSISARGAEYFLKEALPLTWSADWPADPLSLGVMLALPRAIDHPPFSKEASSIEAARVALKDRKQTSLQKVFRLFQRHYWKRRWFKLRTRRVS